MFQLNFVNFSEAQTSSAVRLGIKIAMTTADTYGMKECMPRVATWHTSSLAGLTSGLFISDHKIA